jgi:hypothetical protein
MSLIINYHHHHHHHPSYQRGFSFPCLIIIKNNLNRVTMIEKLPGADLYESFAYDISVLKYFVGVRNGGGREKQSGTSKKRSAVSSRVNPLFGKIRHGIDSSIHSAAGRLRMSLDFSSHSNTSGRMRPASMDGSNHSFNSKKAVFQAAFEFNTNGPPPPSDIGIKMQKINTVV